MKRRQLGIHFIQGVCMGAAQLIPGLSGSTIALIFGIYTRFLDVLYGVSRVAQHGVQFRFSQVIVELKAIRWGFALSILSGMVVAIVGLSQGIDWMLTSFPQYVYALFFGLVLASVSIPWKLISQPKFSHWGTFVLTTGVMVVFFHWMPSQDFETIPLWYVFLGGLISIIGMIFPGISGAFILVVMGQYSFIVAEVKSLSTGSWQALVPVVVFCVGMAVGFVLFVRLLKALIQKAEGTLMAVLTGVLLASLRVLWPFFEVEEGERVVTGVSVFSSGTIVLMFGIMIVGVFLVSLLKRISQRPLV